MAGTERFEEVPLAQRIRENPRPALLWGGVMFVLIAVEFGALSTAVIELIQLGLGAIAVVLTGSLVTLGDLLEGVFGSGVASGFLAVAGPVVGLIDLAVAAIVNFLEGIQHFTRGLWTLLSRDVIPNQGYRAGPDGPWVGTFLGLEPMYAWAIRLVLIFAYAFFFVYWIWRGYLTFREHYRQVEWTPRDDIVRRMRTHRWGQFGFVVVLMFVTMAIFAPALGPTTVEQNIANPCGHEITYFHERAGEVRTTTACDANFNSASTGAGGANIGPLTYDKYGRFHPFGTLPTPGKDLFTFMMAGARVSLFIGLLAIGISGIMAITFALFTAYYKGLVDLVVVVASDSIMTLPRLLLLILVSATFRGHWFKEIFSGGLLIALVLGLTGWPFLWRAMRGPAFQVSEQEWVDAARSYGQRATQTMRRHMLPYVVGYLLIYGSMTLGGVIITTSALSFLGLGIQPPTPEWGRAIDIGQPYVATQSWHISLLPGVMIVLVVTAFNALGDGIRDAVDPQSESSGSEVAAGGTGG